MSCSGRSGVPLSAGSWVASCCALRAALSGTRGAVLGAVAVTLLLFRRPSSHLLSEMKVSPSS
jgi:hypothetical protein